MARSFNGTSDFISVADASSLDLSNAFTLAFFFKPPSEAGWRGLVNKRAGGNNATNYGINYNQDAGTDLLQFLYKTGAGAFRILSTAFAANWPAGTWHHFLGTATQNGTSTDLRIYKNGSLLAGPSTLADNVAPNNVALEIGRSSVGAGEFTGSTIAEVALWNRAISAAEAAAIYYRGPLAVPSGLVFWQRLGMGSPEPDWSGNVNNGTLTGTTVADHPPVGPAFGFDFGWRGAFTAAGAGPAPVADPLLWLGSNFFRA